MRNLSRKTSENVRSDHKTGTGHLVEGRFVYGQFVDGQFIDRRY